MFDVAGEELSTLEQASWGPVKTCFPELLWFTEARGTPRKGKPMLYQQLAAGGQ